MTPAYINFFENELSDSSGKSYLCPDLTTISVAQDPYMYTQGTQLVAIVNRCDIATQVDLENGLVPNYDVESCLDDLTTEDAADEIEQLKVSLKVISQEFDANIYLETEHTVYSIQARYKTGLMAHTSRGAFVYTQKETNIYNPNWLGSGVFAHVYPPLRKQ